MDDLQAAGWNIQNNLVLVPNKGPLSIWNAFAEAMNLDPDKALDIGQEFISAVKWQSECSLCI